VANRPPAPATGDVVAEFLTDLARQGRSANTIRAYRSDLGEFTRFHPGPLASVTPAVLRTYLATLADKVPATRARREAALASLLAWAYRAELIDADPITRLDRTRIPASPPRPMQTGHVDAVLRAIPQHKDRDRLLFTLLYATGEGMRVGEALAIEVDDLDLSRDDEHVTVWGKGRRRRTVLLHDPILVALLRHYLKVRGYRHGPLFRAEKNYGGGPLRYASVQQLWAKYREKAQVRATIISFATSTPPSWSTPGCPWKPSGAASDTPTPKPCSATPTNGTPPPTPKSAPGAAAGPPGARTVDLPRFWSVSKNGSSGQLFNFHLGIKLT
jgi:integrase/recombinase XerD